MLRRSSSCDLKPSLPIGKCCFDPPTQPLLEEGKRAGGGVQFGGAPKIVGSPDAELAHGLARVAGVLGHVVEICD
jgi:hypothetical protein